MSDEQLDLLCDRFFAKFSVVLSEMANRQEVMQKSLDYMADNSDTDHQDFSQMKISMSSIEQSQKELISLMNHNTQKIVQRVGEKGVEAVESASKAVADSVEPVMAQLVEKINKGFPLKKKGFWRWITRR